jgi:hypothetical protein
MVPPSRNPVTLINTGNPLNVPGNLPCGQVARTFFVLDPTSTVSGVAVRGVASVRPCSRTAGSTPGRGGCGGRRPARASQSQSTAERKRAPRRRPVRSRAVALGTGIRANPQEGIFRQDLPFPGNWNASRDNCRYPFVTWVDSKALDDAADRVDIILYTILRPPGLSFARRSHVFPDDDTFIAA